MSFLVWFIIVVIRRLMATTPNTMSIKQGLSLWCPQSAVLNRISRVSVPSRSFRRSFVAASSFDNENREWVFFFDFDVFMFDVCVSWRIWNVDDFRYVVVGGGNAAGYAARTFVEHGQANGKLCIVTKEVSWIVTIDLWLIV